MSSYVGKARLILDQSRALNFCKKTFSKEYSGKVISQYKKLLGITALGIVIFFAVSIVIFLKDPSFSYSYSLYGHYDDGQIRYVENDVKYINMEDWGLDPSEFGPGDDFALLFKYGNIREVMPKEQYDKAGMMFVIEIVGTMIGFFIIVIIWGIAGRKVFPELARYLRWWHTAIGAYGPGLCNNCGRRCSTPEQCMHSNTVK